MILIAISLCSCNYDKFSDLNSSNNDTWNANTSISQLRSSISVIEDDLIIEGIVTANDSSGNFYKEIYIEEQTDNPYLKTYRTARVHIGFYDSHSLYPTGSTLCIKLKGMVAVRLDGQLNIGFPPTSGQYTPEAIPTVAIAQEIIRVNPKSDKQLKVGKYEIDELERYIIGRKVQIDNLYFEVQSGRYGTARVLKELKNDSHITLTTSSYAKFINDFVELGIVEVEAIVIEQNGVLELKINSPKSIRSKKI